LLEGSGDPSSIRNLLIVVFAKESKIGTMSALSADVPNVAAHDSAQLMNNQSRWQTARQPIFLTESQPLQSRLSVHAAD